MSRHLSHHVPYDSATQFCAPSYGLQHGASPEASVLQEGEAISVFLAQGWVLNVSRLRTRNCCLHSRQSNHLGVLDSIHALLKSKQLTGIESNATTTMYGYSGGAIAGAAIGGLPTNFTKFINAANAPWMQVSLPPASTASRRCSRLSQPTSSSILSPRTPPDSKSRARSVKTHSLTHATYGYRAALANTSLSSVLDNNLKVLHDQSRLLNSIGVMGLHGIPKFPLFVWKGTKDEVVPPI